MKYVIFSLTAAMAVAISWSSASAEIAGRWRVAGKVSSFAFTLDCDFKPVGDKLGGVCVDASTNTGKVKAGKSHMLTGGSVRGSAVTWTYRSSFLFSKFDVTYKGVVSGNKMGGTLDAQGHQGEFTAVKE